MTTRARVRVGAALLALVLLAGLFVLGSAAPRAKAAEATEATEAAVCYIVDGAAPAGQDASAQQEGENRLDAAERTVLFRLRQETPPAERADAPRPAVLPTTHTTERSQTESAEEPG